MAAGRARTGAFMIKLGQVTLRVEAALPRPLESRLAVIIDRAEFDDIVC
jgi:hypothetical protein